jgi:replicative DNA helicase
MKNDFTDSESEKILVCQMVLKSDIIAEVYSVVRPESFSDNDYKTAYEYLIKAFNNGSLIDSTMFALGCEKIQPSKRAEITGAAFTADNWRFYADRVRNCYLARECIRLCREVCADLTPENAVESISKILGMAGDVLDTADSGKRMALGDVAPAFLKMLDFRFSHRGELWGYDTGLNNLNEMLGGLPAEYIIIGARPSMGKTALGEQIALKMSESVKVCFWELEMGNEMMFERAVSFSSGVEMNKLRNTFMSESQISIVTEKVQSLQNSKNFILRTETRNIDDIITASRAEVLSRGCKALFIDHAGLIRAAGNYRAPWEGYAEISHKLQELQRELKVPVVILTQLGREAEGAKTTTMANIRGAGAFEEDADIIISIERERAKSATEYQIPTVLNVQKNRNGPTGPVYAVFMPQKVKFVDGKKSGED